jgi:putative flippase GtrA
MPAPGLSAVRRNALWFLAVGGAAALTHLLVFMLVVGLTQHRIWPELANASGFVVAFLVSFFGHRLLSFRDAGTGVAQSFQRFAVTALAGFASNEAVFVLLLRGAGWPALPALLLALLAAAAQTYVLSRFWAFRR